MGLASLIARPSDLPVLSELVARAGTLYDVARGLPLHFELRGRGIALVVELAGDVCVVRHYERGGAIAGVLGDRYARFASNRVLHELHVSEQARARDVATPRVKCGAWYTQGFFQRFDIATEFIPSSKDLSFLLFSEGGPAGPVLELTARLIRSMLRAGLVHEDLNVKNIIVAEERAYVLDLDRCRMTERVHGEHAHRMRERFFRSVNKWEARTGRRVHDVARNVLSDAFHA